MPIEFAKGAGKCHDCGKTLRGRLTISVDNYGFTTSVGLASGELVNRCSDHHNDNREFGQTDVPQHNTFTVTSRRRVIGELGPTSSMAAVSKFEISDDETYRKLNEEIREIQIAKGYTSRR